jgi:hypothetical protein
MTDRLDLDRLGITLKLKPVILYEDFACGIRAKDFAERLADHLACACPLSDRLWRSDLLKCPSVAAEAAASAADSDCLIISTRGDRHLPFPARAWLEGQLQHASRRGAGLIALSCSHPETRRVLSHTLVYLRSLCCSQGVSFFAQVTGAANNLPHSTLSR